MGQVKTRQVKRPEVRKAEILEVALSLFVEKGFEQTTIDAIIGRLNVAKGCFYHHFRSKNEVFEACVVDLSNRLLADYLTILNDPTQNPRQRLVAYLDHNYTLAATPTAPEFLADLQGTFSAIHREVADNVAAGMRPALTQLIKEGVEAGEFETADPEFTAVAVLGALTGLNQFHAGQPGLDLERHRELTLALLERMLGRT